MTCTEWETIGVICQLSSSNSTPHGGQMTGQMINREKLSEGGRVTRSLDGIFREPQLLCSLPGLQVIKSTNDCEPCKIWDESGAKQKGEETTHVRQIKHESSNTRINNGIWKFLHIWEGKNIHIWQCVVMVLTVLCPHLVLFQMLIIADVYHVNAFFSVL